MGFVIMLFLAVGFGVQTTVVEQAFDVEFSWLMSIGNGLVAGGIAGLAAVGRK